MVSPMYDVNLFVRFSTRGGRPHILDVDISGPDGLRQAYLDPYALQKIARVRSLSHHKKLATFFKTSLGQNYLEHAYNRD